MWSLLKQLRTGKRFQEALLTGVFDDSAPDRVFAEWFAERPERGEQRTIFVQLTTGLGCARPVVGDRLLACIGKAMGAQDAHFGSILADELDRLIGPPASSTNPTRHAEQLAAIEAFDSVKARLRSLDHEEFDRIHSEVRDAYLSDGLTYGEAEQVASYLINMFTYMRKNKDPELANVVMASTMTMFRERLYSAEAYAGRFAARLQMDGIRNACLTDRSPVAESADVMYAAVIAGYNAFLGSPDASG